MILLWLLVVVGVAVVSKVVWSRRRLRELAARLPGLPGPSLPLLGDGLQLQGNGEKIFNLFREALIKHDSTFRVWIGPKLWVIITDPEDVKLVLSTKRFLNRDVVFTRSIKSCLGEGLVGSRDETWKIHRKVITPAFHLTNLEQYISIFDKFSKVLIKRLESFADGNTFDVFSIVRLCTLDMTYETTLGINGEFQSKGRHLLFESFDRGLALIRDKIFMPWLLIDWVLNLTERGKIQNRLQNIIENEVGSIVMQKIHEYNNKRTQAESIGHEKKKPSFVDMLLKACECQGEVLTQDNIRDEVYTLFAAAQETSAVTNSLVLILLGLHPDHQEKVVQELNSIFGQNEERPVTSEDLLRVKYLERVIKETLRLFPGIPLLPREITEEVKINTCTLPAGCTAAVFNYGTHRDPRIYPEPNQFDPDRFLPDRVQARHPYSFLGFGTGPRMCVGYKYAMLSMKTLLSTVLRRYRVLPASSRQDLEYLEIGLVLKPVRGLNLKLLPRQFVAKQTLD